MMRAGIAIAPMSEGVDPESEIAALASVDIEMSKYLGGDVAHT